VASGNRGVGKSVVATNLGLLLSREGRRVVLVDLDNERANLHLLFGIFQPNLSLTDFYSHKVGSLEHIAQTIGWGSGLRLIPGVGDALPDAIPSYAEHQRLIRHLRHMDADVVILDCQPGTDGMALDCFLSGDYQIVVANPESTSVIDLYRFLKLAAMRKVMNDYRGDNVGKEGGSILEKNFQSLEQVLRMAKELDPLSPYRADEILKRFIPLFVLNRTNAQTKMSIAYLQQVVAKFIGSELVFLGEIPQNDAVEQSTRVFQPLVDLAPKSLAAKAFQQITTVLMQRLEHGVPVLVS